MTNREIAEALARQAQEILLEAEGLLARQAWNLVVRRAQEAAEMALKASLRWVGVEVPHVHDVGLLLKDHAGRFPEGFREHVERLASISRRLARERELSFYGDEAAGVPPQRLYTEDDAGQALEEARFVLDRCVHLVSG